MESFIIFEIIALFSPLISLAFAFFSLRRSQKNDDSATAREMGTLLTEVGYIKSQMDALNHKLERHDERYESLVERVSAAETSVETAHRRVDALVKYNKNQEERV